MVEETVATEAMEPDTVTAAAPMVIRIVPDRSSLIIRHHLAAVRKQLAPDALQQPRPSPTLRRADPFHPADRPQTLPP